MLLAFSVMASAMENLCAPPVVKVFWLWKERKY